MLPQPLKEMTTLTPTVDTLLGQLGGARQIKTLTRCQIVTDDNSVKFVFGRQVGPAGKKITHLRVTYQEAYDLYLIEAWKMNRKTFEMVKVVDMPQVNVAELKEICERACNLFFTF